MRILGATRLSHDTDTSTSIERQSESIQKYAESGRHTVVKITEDVDVSGAVSPFDRPELGQWLTDPKLISQWDALVVAKLDRISRSIIDFVTLIKWCEDQGKTIICLDPNFDMSTPFGRAIANILMVFAQFEREMTSIRVKDSRKKLRSLAWWSGGSIPPGYRPVKFTDHNELEPDPDKSELINRIGDLLIAGNSSRQIAAKLNSEGIPTITGRTWDGGALIRIMRNPSLRGYVMHNEEVVRDDDGMPVQRTPIIDDDKWVKIQKQLDKNSNPQSGVRKGARLLTGIIYCECGEPLYYHSREINGKPQDRFRHADKTPCKNTYASAKIEKLAEDHILRFCKDLPMMEKIEIPAEDHTRELATVQQSIDDLDAQFEKGTVSAETYGRMTARLETKRDKLAALPVSQARTEYKSTGVMFTDHYSGLDESERHQLLLSYGIRVDVSRGNSLAESWTGVDGMTMTDLLDTAIVTYSAGKNLVKVDAGKWSELREMARAA